MHLGWELLHELLALGLEHLLERLAVHLLHRGQRVLGDLLHITSRLRRIDLAIGAAVSGLRVLLVVLLVTLIERIHALLL